MTRKPAPERTRPLDRDGDGKDGGSLPGNKTAPMAGAHAKTPATEWTRDNEAIASKLAAAGVRDHDETTLVTVEQVTQWHDEDAREAEAFADAMTAEGSYTDNVGDERRSDDTAIDLPAILAERHVLPRATDPVSEAAITDQVRPVSDDHVHAEPQTEAAQDETGDGPDTFTPEEIAAGETPVVEQEGEATTTAADAATVIADDDPLVTIDTETAPIAVRLRELETLINARRLYRSPQGYSATYAAPFIEEATVKGWIRAGLAEDIPTAGNSGGVKLTAEARQVATRLRQQLAEAA